MACQTARDFFLDNKYSTICLKIGALRTCENSVRYRKYLVDVVSMTPRIPVFLLKTKSLPADGYEEYFDQLDEGRYSPIFVPVLEHKFTQYALQIIKQHILNGAFLPFDPSSQQSGHKYGGMIFTSQRAVEAFTYVIDELREQKLDVGALFSASLPIYVVGPATGRGLRALGLPCQIVGEEAGNGEALAAFMLEHYDNLWSSRQADGHIQVTKPSLLFLVGEQRRDIIPKTLMSASLPEDLRIDVEELTVYETGVMENFSQNFAQLVIQNLAQVQKQWVIVFSPTGCKAMLEVLGMLNRDTGKVKDVQQTKPAVPYIATIGPTTRDYLISEFGYTPDVCAIKPSAEGLGEVILDFEQKQSNASK